MNSCDHISVEASVKERIVRKWTSDDTSQGHRNEPSLQKESDGPMPRGVKIISKSQRDFH